MLAQGFGSKPAKAKKIKSRTPKASQPCPCFSGKPYGECCKPFHEGEKKPQPVEVMRARYAAFAWCVSRVVCRIGLLSLCWCWFEFGRVFTICTGAAIVKHSKGLSMPSSVRPRMLPPENAGCIIHKRIPMAKRLRETGFPFSS